MKRENTLCLGAIESVHYADPSDNETKWGSTVTCQDKVSGLGAMST